MHARSLLCLLAASLVPALGHADILSVKVENDIIATGSDGHYTNGVEVIWGFAPDDQNWTRRFADLLPGWSGSNLDNVAYRFGHHCKHPVLTQSSTFCRLSRKPS